MLEHAHLENFKANRDVEIRIAPLTVLAGMNSSGKSTLLQALGALRQSYDANGVMTGLRLTGHLVQLGRYRDVLNEGTEGEAIRISVLEDGTQHWWSFQGDPESSQPGIFRGSAFTPRFVLTPNFQFLQADRIVPKTLYPQAPQEARTAGFLGTRGEFTPDFLATAAERPVREARNFNLATHELDPVLFGKAAPTRGLLDQVSGWLQLLSPGARLNSALLPGTDEVLLQFSYVGKLRDAKSNLYRPTNVGFGLTYSLPILVSCLASEVGALLLLENPEAHLHPRGQAALGELLARSANDGVQIIAETHSDHLLNGIRLAVKNGLIRPNDVALHFFARSTDSGEVSVESPALLDTGRLSNWPRGFFDQWDKDIQALLE